MRTDFDSILPARGRRTILWMVQHVTSDGSDAASRETHGTEREDLAIDDERLILGDLLNHVLDKGVVISGNVTISIADIDLLTVDLRLLLTSVESSLRRGLDQSLRSISSGSERQ